MKKIYRFMTAASCGLLISLAGTVALAQSEEGTLTSRYEELKALALEKIGWDEEGEEADVDDSTLDEKLEVIQEYYEESKETTAEVSREAYEWLKQDINRIGGWDYEVLSLSDQGDEELQETLSALGAQNWNLVSAVDHGGRIVFILKRPQKSYVNVLPAKEVLKLMSDQGVGEGSSSAQ